MAISLQELNERFARHGELRWIGVRPAQSAPMDVVERVRAIAGRGLDGDRTALRVTSERQVTLFQFEHLAVLASLLGRDQLPPELLRRNLAVSGINVLALRARRFSIGALSFEGTGNCAPCRRMEDTLGPGGFNASRGHGGITARVLSDGWIQIGDVVGPLPGGAATGEMTLEEHEF
jgi:MOSC domain-containing protein YiiM